jgi:D-glycero-D-manno-heptose 1,7-bisphosphate phosphatase
MTKALFLDRDGVVNIDKEYLYKIDEFEFVDGIFDICKLFLKHNFILIIITNQSGIGRGYYTQKDFEVLNSWMIKQFAKQNIKISKTYFCPHTPQDDCVCRKPKAYMINQAVKKFDIDVSKSVLIGDKDSDIICGKTAKIAKTIYINHDKNTNSNINIKDFKELIQKHSYVWSKA